MALSSDWVKDLKTEKEKADFTKLVLNDRRVLGRLLKLIDEKMATIDRAEENKDTYENPAYASWQAHMNGRRASLRDVRRLLEFLEA